MKKIFNVFLYVSIAIMLNGCTIALGFLASVADDLQKKEEIAQKELLEKEKIERAMKAEQDNITRATELISLFANDIESQPKNVLDEYMNLMPYIKMIDLEQYYQINQYLCDVKTYFGACDNHIAYLFDNEEQNQTKLNEYAKKTLNECTSGYGMACDTLYKHFGSFSVKQSGSFIMYESPFLNADIISSDDAKVTLQITKTPYTVNTPKKPYTVEIPLFNEGLVIANGSACLKAMAEALEYTSEIGEYSPSSAMCRVFPSQQFAYYSANEFDEQTPVKGTKDRVYIEVPQIRIRTPFGEVRYMDGFIMAIEKDIMKQIINRYQTFFKNNMEFHSGRGVIEHY